MGPANLYGPILHAATEQVGQTVVIELAVAAPAPSAATTVAAVSAATVVSAATGYPSSSARFLYVSSHEPPHPSTNVTVSPAANSSAVSNAEAGAEEHSK